MKATPGTMVPTICAAIGAHLTPQEAQVIRALSPAALRSAGRISNRPLSPPEAATVLTSAISIQIPVEPMSAVRDASPIPPFLPRLPFPVTLFELYDSDGDHNCFTRGEIATGERMEIVAVVFAETEPGHEWIAWPIACIGTFGGQYRFLSLRMSIHADGERMWVMGAEGRSDDQEQWSIRDAWACAQLATARGAVTTPSGFASRQQRRQYERRLGWKPPRMYHLDIGGAHDSDSHAGSGRVYTCRWLVRGHWRELDRGGHTWVRPYIKGPLDAPFRGRPSYRVVA